MWVLIHQPTERNRLRFVLCTRSMFQRLSSAAMPMRVPFRRCRETWRDSTRQGTNAWSSQGWGDQSGVYVQEKAEQIDRLQCSLAAALTSEQTQLQAIQQRAPGWTAGKKAHAQWEQQVARRETRITQIALRLDRVGGDSRGRRRLCRDEKQRERGQGP